MAGILGKKIGMTSIFTVTEDNGVQHLACTLIEAGPCVVSQVKTKEKDGYESVQLAFDDKKEKSTTKQMIGHFAKAKSTPKRKVVEFKDFTNKPEFGTTLTVADIFKVGEKINVVGITKGKGFQGVVKRHGFAGVGGQTHGQHNRLRHPGSIGACSYPSRVFKGIRMAGRMGNDRVKIQNLKILKIIPEQNLLLVSGSVPGAKNSYLIIQGS